MATSLDLAAVDADSPAGRADWKLILPCQVASIAESVKTKMDVFGCINRV